ncbi:hypothetical protein GGR62_000283 [Xanthomonas campestris]|nr:hypothetical protein [Xanthomonas sp. 3075]
MMPAVIGDMVAAMARRQALTAFERRSRTVVVVVVVTDIAPICAPVIVAVVATVRAMCVMPLFDASMIVVLLLGRSERCTRGQQRQNHERSNDLRHLPTLRHRNGLCHRSLGAIR